MIEVGGYLYKAIHGLRLRLEPDEREQLDALLRPYIRPESSVEAALTEVESALTDYQLARIARVDDSEKQRERKRISKQIERLERKVKELRHEHSRLSLLTRAELERKMDPTDSIDRAVAEALDERDPLKARFPGGDLDGLAVDLGHVSQILTRYGRYLRLRATLVRGQRPRTGRHPKLADRALTHRLAAIWQRHTRLHAALRNSDDEGGPFVRFSNAAGRLVNSDYSARRQLRDPSL